MDWNTLYSKKNLLQWSKSQNTLTILYGQILITVFSPPIGPGPGWNIKYKKGGKSLCTLYPMQGYFIVLVVVGSRELTEAEFLMPQCSDYVQTVFKNTKTGNGQKWLMLDVRDREIMDDVFRLINLRKRIPS